MLELAELIWRKIKGRRAVPVGVRRGLRARRAKRVPATEKAKQVLGFEATTTLDDMLDEVIPWIEQAVAEGRI